MSNPKTVDEEPSGEPTPDQIERWWAAHTMHPVHEDGIEYVRECPNCEAGDSLRRLGLDPYGDGIGIFVGLVQDHRRLAAQLAGDK